MKSYRLIKPPRALALAFAIVLSLISGSTRADALFSYLSTNYVKGGDDALLAGVGIEGLSFRAKSDFPAGTKWTVRFLIAAMENPDGINWDELTATAVTIQDRTSYWQSGSAAKNPFGRLVTLGTIELDAPMPGKTVLEDYPIEQLADEYGLIWHVFKSTTIFQTDKDIAEGTELVVNIACEINRSKRGNHDGDLIIMGIGCSPEARADGPVGVGFFGSAHTLSSQVDPRYLVPMSEIEVEEITAPAPIKLSIKFDSSNIVISWPAKCGKFTLQSASSLRNGTEWTDRTSTEGITEYRIPSTSDFVFFRGIR